MSQSNFTQRCCGCNTSSYLFLFSTMSKRSGIVVDETINAKAKREKCNDLRRSLSKVPIRTQRRTRRDPWREFSERKDQCAEQISSSLSSHARKNPSESGGRLLGVDKTETITGLQECETTPTPYLSTTCAKLGTILQSHVKPATVEEHHLFEEQLSRKTAGLSTRTLNTSTNFLQNVALWSKCPVLTVQSFFELDRKGNA